MGTGSEDMKRAARTFLRAACGHEKARHEGGLAQANTKRDYLRESS